MTIRQAADVYKRGVLAAQLERHESGTRFTYRSDYVAADKPSVAATLPVSDRPVDSASGAVPAFFAGLLPEGRRLNALRKAVKTSADDELSLLLAVGAILSEMCKFFPKSPTETKPLRFRSRARLPGLRADIS